MVNRLAIVMPPPPPFWMTENEFRSHFSLFQIITQLFIFFISCSQDGCRRPFWMTENHFRSHFSPFQINTQLYLFLIFFTKWLPAAILDYRKFFNSIISRHFRSIRNFLQNGCRRPSWPKITFDGISRHFRSIRNFFFFSQK